MSDRNRNFTSPENEGQTLGHARRESDGPAGGWGSVKGMVSIAVASHASPAVADTLAHLNKPDGAMCTSCAWPKPANYQAFEFCENGAKAALWDLTTDRCGADFWQEHSVKALRAWSDHDLEATGRLTEPLKYDAATDRYAPVSWAQAYEGIAAELKQLRPDEAVFYASGHAGLEASYLYALLARAHGTNNLPQSSNMCHETTSVGLNRVIGSPVGTVIWEDLENADAFFFFGQNPGTNSPRFLRPLKEAKARGARIVTFNPIREQGLLAFVDPQNLGDMLTGHETRISDQYHQVRSGGDIAALMGLCKAVLQADADALRLGSARVLDVDFLNQHTTGFDHFADAIEQTSWDDIEQASGLSRADLTAAAQVYIGADRVIGVYGMGLTQHSHGTTNVGMLVNFLMLRGNLGRLGAGCCPVRGHSNVQGQRSVGIAEKAHLVPLDTLQQLFHFEPPRLDGFTVVEAAQGVISGQVKAMVCLGGNLLRALPDTPRIEKAWPQLDLGVMVSTRLNRSHLFPGRHAYILPCLSRLERDVQATGEQVVTIEDSFSMIHASRGRREPASDRLQSEMGIVCGIAQALLPRNPHMPWSTWQSDYGLVRDLIEATYPEQFGRFNERMFTPGGFHRGNAVRQRVWKTPEGKAVFTTPHTLNAGAFPDAPGRFRLITLRSNDQFNTTIYGLSDRFRGIEGTRDVLLMNAQDMRDLGLAPGETVGLRTDRDDLVARHLGGLTLVEFSLPSGTLASYYPECNVLVPLDLHDEASLTPASKSIPVRVQRGGVDAAPLGSSVNPVN